MARVRPVVRLLHFLATRQILLQATVRSPLLLQQRGVVLLPHLYVVLMGLAKNTLLMELLELITVNLGVA